MSLKSRKVAVHTMILAGFVSMLSLNVQASSDSAFKVYDKVISVEELMKQEQDKFYRLEKEKFQLIEGMAKSAFLEAYWAKQGKEKGISAEKARDQYMEQHVKFTEKEVKETLDKYKSHPKLKEMPAKEQEDQIKNLLKMRGEQQITQAILDEGIKSGQLKILATRPQEPIYDIKVTKDDHVRFGPADADVKPVAKGCKGDDCLITVVEYSEFQCPFCSRVIPAVKQLLDEYKGKIRWIVRDFPLNFHDRARPAAIAAKCAAFQGDQKYWEMYEILFKNQHNLGDADITKYATEIKLDAKKFKACQADSKKAEALIDANMNSGVAVGVTGTPAFFINGRRLSGALPYEEFKRVIEEELIKKAPAKGQKS